MAVEETNIVNAIMKAVSGSGCRLFRNVRGSFYTIDSVKALIGAVISGNSLRIKTALTNLRQLAAGLIVPGNGGSDLIGFTPIVVTQAMVGMKIAVFTAVEVKTATGRPSPDQLRFVTYVKENGGYSGIARSPEDALKIINLGG